MSNKKDPFKQVDDGRNDVILTQTADPTSLRLLVFTQEAQAALGMTHEEAKAFMQVAANLLSFQVAQKKRQKRLKTQRERFPATTDTGVDLKAGEATATGAYTAPPEDSL